MAKKEKSVDEKSSEVLLDKAQDLFQNPKMMYFLMSSAEMLKLAASTKGVWDTHGISVLLSGILAKAEDSKLIKINEK